MSDGFVVLQSYVDSINLLPPERRWPFFEELFRYRMDGVQPEPQTDLERMALVNIFPVIDKSVERYAANKENGQKGGRPTKRAYIAPEVWQAYLNDHSQKETAEHFNISERTLRRWIAAVNEKADKTGQNQDIDIDMDMDTDKDIHIHTISNNKKEKAATPKTPKSVSATRYPPIDNAGINPCMPGYQFEAHGHRYKFNENREVVDLGPI